MVLRRIRKLRETVMPERINYVRPKKPPPTYVPQEIPEDIFFTEAIMNVLVRGTLTLLRTQ